MKILMTGATKAQCDQFTERGRKQIIQKIDVPVYVIESLEGQGHQVTQRPVVPGEDLTDFDLLWINVAGILSFHGAYGLGMLWAMHQSYACGIPAVMFFDDWKVKNTLHHIGWMCDSPENFEKQLKKAETGTYPLYPLDQVKATREDAGFSVDMMIAGRKFCSFDWQDTRWMCVCPQYAWGSMTPELHKLFRGLNLARYRAIDPTSQVPLLESARATLKMERYALASLSDQREWVSEMRLKWPVEYFGYRGDKKTAFKPKRLKTEELVQQEYAKSWGILSPPYEHSGSGWWRSRFLYAANGESVLIADPKETLGLGADYHVTPQTLEIGKDLSLRITSYGDRQLIARQQRDIFWAGCWTGTDWHVGVRRLVEDTHALGLNT